MASTSEASQSHFWLFAMRFRIVALSLCAMLISIPSVAVASEWHQERAYEEIAVLGSDELRFGLYVVDGRVYVDVLDGSGVVLRTIDLRNRFYSIRAWATGHSLDVWDDRLVVSVAASDALDTNAYWLFVLEDERLVARLRWGYRDDVGDLSMNGAWVFAGVHEASEVSQLHVFDFADLKAAGLLEEPIPNAHTATSAVIPLQDPNLLIRSVAADESGVFVFVEFGSTVEEYSNDLTLVATSMIKDLLYFTTVDGHPGTGGTFVAMPVAPPSESTCAVSTHAATGERIDCFLEQSGGASWDQEGGSQEKYGGFDVDGCGGIVVPDRITSDGLTGHKLIPSNRDLGCFVDSLDSIFVNAIRKMGRARITVGCNPPDSDRYCPDQKLSRAEIAAFFARARGLPAPSKDYFTDDNGHILEGAINRIAEAEITQGCNPPASDHFCPDRTITRGEIAAFFARVLGLGPASQDHFTDDNGHIFENAINRIAEAGITVGCNPPANDHFCPDAKVTRGQAAALFARAFDL